MFEIGWAELLLIGAIALFVIGPKDLPHIAYQIGKVFRRLKYLQFALTGQFEDFMKQAEAKVTAEKDAETPQEQKRVLDYDPYDEALADAELMEMIPTPATPLVEGEHWPEDHAAPIDENLEEKKQAS